MSPNNPTPAPEIINSAPGPEIIKPAPAPEIIHPIPQRRQKLADDFGHIMFGLPGPAIKKAEDAAMPLAQELLPDVSPELQRALIRIAGLYTKDARGVTDFMATRYFDLLETYAYGIERDNARAEGASAYWLFLATNNQLRILDQVHIPVLSEHLLANTHQVLAARSLLRIGALVMDIGKIGSFEKIHEIIKRSKAVGKVGYNLPDPEAFTPRTPPAAVTQASEPPSLPA